MPYLYKHSKRLVISNHAVVRKLSIRSMIAIALFLLGCENSKTKEANKALKTYEPGSNKYKQLLAEQLTNYPRTFTCVFEKYFVKDGGEYLSIRIQRSDFHTVESVIVKDWNKLEGIKRTKGLGYRGAELRGLRLVVNKKDDNSTFVYQTIDKIID